MALSMRGFSLLRGVFCFAPLLPDVKDELLSRSAVMPLAPVLVLL